MYYDLRAISLLKWQAVYPIAGVQACFPVVDRRGGTSNNDVLEMSGTECAGHHERVTLGGDPRAGKRANVTTELESGVIMRCSRSRDGCIAEAERRRGRLSRSQFAGRWPWWLARSDEYHCEIEVPAPASFGSADEVRSNCCPFCARDPCWLASGSAACEMSQRGRVMTLGVVAVDSLLTGVAVWQ